VAVYAQERRVTIKDNYRRHDLTNLITLPLPRVETQVSELLVTSLLFFTNAELLQLKTA
jgi:hypothetical protein